MYKACHTLLLCETTEQYGISKRFSGIVRTKSAIHLYYEKQQNSMKLVKDLVVLFNCLHYYSMLCIYVF